MFSDSFLKTAAMDPVPEHLKDKKKPAKKKSKQDRTLKYLEEGYRLLHSPTLEGLQQGAKAAIPTAAIAAIASPKGNRLRNAAALGTLAGVMMGIPAAIRQGYVNKLEDAHVKFHMDRINKGQPDASGE